MADFSATVGADLMNGTSGDDVFSFAAGTVTVGDVFVGGAGFDTAQILGGATINFDFYNGVPSPSNQADGFERIEFVAGGTAIFAAYQFSNFLDPGWSALSVAGSAGQDNIVIRPIDSGVPIDASGWAFSGWDSNQDTISFEADTEDNIFIGTSFKDRFVFEQFDANGVDDFDGGAGVDTLVILGNVGFIGLGLSSIEAVELHGTSVSFAASQFGGGHISTSLAVSGGVGDDRINVASTVNFDGSGWTFSNWNSPADSVFIDCTVGADTVTGTTEFDLVHGLAGEDFLVGLDGDDSLSGGANDDILFGDGQGGFTGISGDDELFGDGGDDVMRGGDGVDHFNGGDGFDRVSFATTTVFEGAVADLFSQDVVNDGFGNHETMEGVEALSGTQFGDIFTGDEFENLLIGAGGNDSLSGGDGTDTLDGGVGADALDGGSGFGPSFDTATYAASAGRVRVNLATGAGLDNDAQGDTLVNIEGVIGSAFNDILTGRAGANQLEGLAGNDTLDGGAGADLLIGGDGDDTYVVDNPADITTETSASGGIDLVLSSVTRVLTANLENLTLTGSAAINGTGNGLVNVLIGNAAANVLDGKTGVDTMIGGGGDDTYVVNVSGDVTTESSASGGIDLVKSAVTRTLGANLEQLTLTGVAAINGTGNALSNVITGNAAANMLSGLAGNDSLDGGGGADTMAGGAGNDIYFVDNAGDVISEAVGAGTDLVGAYISLTLGAHLENLTLLGSASSGVGNSLDNVIMGNAVANALSGSAGFDTLSGGAGHDSLAGGANADTFVFNAPAIAANSDTITDFAHSSDKIQFENAVFTQIGGAGALNANAFFAGANAHDASDRIIYNAATGALYYDDDGTGAHAKVLIATLTTHPTLTNTDIQVI